MNLHGLSHHKADRLPGKGGSITVPAEVKLNKVLQSAGLRRSQYSSHQLSGLRVRKVPLTTENTGDQHGWATAAALHLDIVVELQCKNIRLAQRVDEDVVPGSQVGCIGKRPAAAPDVRCALETKAARHLAVVGHGKRPATQMFATQNIPARLVVADQACPPELAEGLALSGQNVDVIRMATKGDAQLP